MSRTMLTNEPSGRKFFVEYQRPAFVSRTLPDDWKPEGDPHAAHRRMEMEKLVGVCKPCARRKLAWMDRQPRTGHIYRAAVRFHLLYDEVLK